MVLNRPTITCTGDLYVERIERTECIGNSLVKINNNFKKLDTATCQTENNIIDLLTLVTELSSRRPKYVPLTGIYSNGVSGTGDLSSVVNLSYDSTYATKSGSVTYNISQLQGSGLDTAKITHLHIVADIRMYANDLERKANLYVTYPNSGYKPLLQTIIDAGIGVNSAAMVANSIKTTCIVPINNDTTTISLSVNTNYAAHGERASFEIIGATMF
jgi:hypothetical protein